jgi:hypothetical protein
MRYSFVIAFGQLIISTFETDAEPPHPDEVFKLPRRLFPQRFLDLQVDIEDTEFFVRRVTRTFEFQPNKTQVVINIYIREVAINQVLELIRAQEFPPD